MEKSNWKVRFDTFLTHIRHDIEKGETTGKKYQWGEYTATVQGNEIDINGTVYPVKQLGTESGHSQDQTIFNFMPQGKNNILTTKEETTMNTQTRNEIASLAQTVGAQFKEAGVISLKQKSGEALLQAIESLVLEKAGFVGRAKFKLMPQALDILVAGGVSVLVAEYAGENHAAAIGAEALRLAAMRRVTDLLPITDIVGTLTAGGKALENIGNK